MIPLQVLVATIDGAFLIGELIANMIPVAKPYKVLEIKAYGSNCIYNRDITIPSSFILNGIPDIFNSICTAKATTATASLVKT